MFEFITHFFLRKIIESQIKASFADEDESKTRLKQWLVVAMGGTFEAEAWNYQFENGDSLVHFAIDSSDELLERYRNPRWYETLFFSNRNKLNESQSYYKSIFQIWIQSKKEVDPKTVEELNLRWYHRFFTWCVQQSGLIWRCESNILNDSELFSLLKKHENLEEELGESHQSIFANELSLEMVLQEKHSVNQLLSSPSLIFKRITNRRYTKAIPLQEEARQSEPLSLAPHMQPWLTELKLHQAIDQAHQHQVQQEQNVVQSIELKDLQPVAAVRAWADTSILNEKWDAYRHAMDSGCEASASWLFQLSEECECEWLKTEAYGSSLDKDGYRFFISEAALNKLLEAKGHIRSQNGYSLGLETLPLGFFIDRDKEGRVYSLKYNEKYRLYQLANLPDRAMRIDVGESLSEFHMEISDYNCSVTKDDLIQTLHSRQIKLNARQHDFLERLDKDPHRIQFKLNKSYHSTQFREDSKEIPLVYTKSFAFRALKLMAESIYPLPQEKAAAEKQDPFLGEFIDILDSFPALDEDESLHRFDWPYANYLNVFTLSFLKGIKNGKEYYAADLRNALKRVAKFTSIEYRWFVHLVGDAQHTNHNFSFSEVSKGLFYFLDYFYALGVGIPDPPTGWALRREFSILRYTLDCISLSGHGKDKSVKQFQARLASNLPSSRSAARTALRSGYAFVHKSMLLGEGDFEDDIISDWKFESAIYGHSSQNEVKDQVYFRALYLRFIACYVEPAYFEEALAQWKEVTGTDLNCTEHDEDIFGKAFDRLHKALQNRWPELQAYVLGLPRVLQVHPSEKSNEIVEAFVNDKMMRSQTEKRYEREQIEVLFKKLNLPQELVHSLLNQIEEINALSPKYAVISENELEKDLKSIRKYSLVKQICILRETHSRLTCASSKANPPEGEWLRLEQLVSILIGIMGDSLLQIDTGEGKTFILQMIALLKALEGHRVDVITHNEPLALEAGDKIKRLARLVNLKIAKKIDSAQAIINADILYMDISSAVINDLFAIDAPDSELLPGKRQASIAVIDEVDNIVIDIHAKTKMQISCGGEEADEDLKRFLIYLNALVREKLPSREDLSTPSLQREWIRDALNQKLVGNRFYQAVANNDEELDTYIRASVTAMQLKKDRDYVVEKDDLVIDEVTFPRKVIRIIHKDTTGRVDKISQWGSGVHQCVAAFELLQDLTIHVPGITKVLSEGNIPTYLKKRYVSRVGVSATLGDEPVKEKIIEIIDAKQVVIMPRAVRPLDGKASWPLKEGKPEYNRAYQFASIYLDSELEHLEVLLEAIKNIQQNGQSGIIFFNTISECDAFYSFLTQNGISSNFVQILDDTHDEEESLAQGKSLRPSEATVIERAKEPTMITLTTAAGSRGTDFDDINVDILAKPNLGRVSRQKAGRVARNGQFGMVYEIYNIHDLEQREFQDIYNCSEHRGLIAKHEKITEDQSLEAINQRQLTDEYCSFFRKNSLDRERNSVGKESPRNVLAGKEPA